MRIGRQWAVSLWNLHALGVLVTLIACGQFLLPTPAGASCPNVGLRVAASAGLPDCRAYEQVSPVEKGGSSAYPLSPAFPAQTLPSGEKIGYYSLAAFPGALGNTVFSSSHLDTRTATGWENEEWMPSIPKTEALKGYQVSLTFSEDLTHALLQIPLIPLTPDATPYIRNLFLRHPDGTYSLVNAGKPTKGVPDLCEPVNYSFCWNFIDLTAPAGASTDFSHVLFESNGQWTPEGPPTGNEGLYENRGGQVSLVGVLPDAHPAMTSTAGAGSSVLYVVNSQEAGTRIEHAVSANGSHVIFSAPSDAGEPNESGQNGLTEVYDRIEGSETIEISAPNSGAPTENQAPAPATFWAASTDGSHVFFTSAAELTTQAKSGDEGGQDLYEYDFEMPVGERLTDLSVSSAPHGARMQGVVDASADGRYIYFVAMGQLDGSKGTDGQPNLYVSHVGEAPVFIATLSGTGACFANSHPDSCDWSPFPKKVEAYLTPDGRHMAFMSTQSLPTANFPDGYDNTDQSTGEADSEIYEYSAEDKELRCGSCDLSGERPVGNAVIGGTSTNGITQEGKFQREGISTPFSKVRALSDSGNRLFYTAPGPGAGGSELVFEYEADGEGSCTSPGGCQYSLSGPNGGTIDQFLGTSANGRDVFFATASRLVPGDQDKLRDVYDARVNGGFPAPAAEPRCESQCLQAKPPQADQPIPTSTVGPSGNVAMSPSPPQRLPAQVKKCKKHHKLSHHKCVKLKRTRRRRAVSRISARAHRETRRGR